MAEVIRWSNQGPYPADPQARQIRQNTAPAPGFDVQMRSAAAIDQTLTDVARDISRAADSMAMFTVGPQSVRAVLQEGLDSISTTLQQATQATMAQAIAEPAVLTQPGTVSVPMRPAALAGPNAPVAAPAAPPVQRSMAEPVEAQGPRSMVSPASRGRVRRTREIAEEQGVESIIPSWRPGQQLPTMQGVRTNLGRRLTQWANQTGQSDLEQISVDTPLGRMPQWVHKESEFVDTAMGQIPRRQAVDMGIVSGERTVASQAEVAAMGQVEAQSARRAVVGKLGGALAEGEGVMGTVGTMLPASVTKVLGPIGLTIGAIQQGLNFMESQREANAPWQRIGGYGQGEAMRERGRERMFGWSQMGTMGKEMAAQMFEGVSQLGLTGAERGRALDFAVDKFRDYGMDITDSLNLISESIKDGSVSLGDFSVSLDRVTDAAKDAGINTDEARKSFIANVQAMSPMLGGEAANSIAAAFTTNLSRMGAQYQGLNLGIDENMMRRMAAMNNMGYSQWVGTVTGPGGAVQAAQGVETVARQQMTNLLGGGGIADLQSIAQRRFNKSLEELTGSQREIVGNEWLRSGRAPDIATIENILGNAGVTGVTNQNVAGTTVAAATGRLFPNAEAMQPQDVSAQSQAELGAGFEQRFGYKNYERDVYTVTEGGAVDSQTNFLYGQWVESTGRTSPTIEALLKKGYGRKDLFEVQTKDGPRQVNFEEALQFYGDQLASGEARLVKGSGKDHAGDVGTMTKDISGTGGDAGTTVTSAQEPAKAGKKFNEEDWEADQAKDAEDKEGKGKIIVEAAPALENLIRLSGANVSTTYGPSGGNPSTGSLPTGKTGVR